MARGGKVGNRSKTGQAATAEQIRKVSESIKQWHKDNQGKRLISRRKWQATYRCIGPDGKIHTTTRLTQFCKKNKLSLPRMVEIAGFHAGGVLVRTPYHRGWSCYKVGSLQHNRRRTSILFN